MVGGDESRLSSPAFVLPRALKSSQHSLCSLLIVDTPGFQNPRLGQQQRGATFEELCHNYTQERLQTLFHERTFVREMERYKEVLAAPHPPRARWTAALTSVHAEPVSFSGNFRN